MEILGGLIVAVVLGVIVKLGRRHVGNHYNARYDEDPNPPLIKRAGGRHPYRYGRHDIEHCRCKGQGLGDEGCRHKKANFDYNMANPKRVIHAGRMHLLGFIIVVAVMVLGYYWAYTNHLL